MEGTEKLVKLYEEEESFRDHLSTLDEKGNRKWLFPKKPFGRYYNARKWVSYLLLIILFGAPFIDINGEPLILLNVFTRKFVIFGQIFWPQDFHLFAIGLIAFVLFIVLFTVIYGRIFCGWVCPQTIFMEMVFRRIEYFIEGDYMAQKKLNNSQWNFEKIWKKNVKHTIFLLISFLITHTFIAYLIGVDGVQEIVASSPVDNIVGFLSMFVFTALFYWIFAFFREQVCTNICPYGRLQGVLLDRDSVIVAYNHKRGEARSKFRNSEDRNKLNMGDCIDCKQCIYVCPTGIDIRNGTQLECVNCTACIDACDSIMDRVGFKRGLIGYTSDNQIQSGGKFRFTSRMYAYTGLLVVLMGVFGGLLTFRSDIETTILRTPGIMYQDQGNGTFSNIYNFKIINKTNFEIPIELRILENAGSITIVGGETISLSPQGVKEGAMFIYMTKDQIDGVKTKLEIGIYSSGKLLETIGTTFLGPAY